MRRLTISKVQHNASKILRIYYKEINKEYNIDEVELSNKIKLGDTLALDLLVKANLKFVVSVANQYMTYGLPIEDLINEGNMGLINAAKQFDSDRGFKFISYAVWHIRQSILKYIKDTLNVVRVPINVQSELNTLKKLVNTTEQELGIEMTYSTAHALLEDPKLESVFTSYGKKDVSLDEVIGDDTFTLGDGLILLDNTFRPDMIINNNDSLSILNEAIKSLTYTEQQVIILTYGLNNRAALNISNICQELNIGNTVYIRLLRKSKKQIKSFITNYDTRSKRVVRKKGITSSKIKNVTDKSNKLNKKIITKPTVAVIKTVSDEIILDNYFGIHTGVKSTISTVASTLNISKADVHVAVYRYKMKQKQKEKDNNKKRSFFSTIKKFLND